MKDWVTGEEVNYQYDALNRLLSAETTSNAWGQAYVFDGFGNLFQQTVTKGTAPAPTFSVNPATNRLTTTTYDANGNDFGTRTGARRCAHQKMGTYDRLNRLKTASGATYDYAPDLKRVWKRKPDGSEEFYFYLGNQRLGTYSHSNGPYSGTFATISTNLYFGGKMLSAQGSTILTDRLGSNVTSGKRYFPWGQEQPSATSNNTEKFTGYFRDAESGLDYADQRYHNPGSGRFITHDPVGYGLNWYSFVDGDPVNTMDPTGGTPITRFPGGGPSFVTWVNPSPLTPTFYVSVWASSIPNTPTGPFQNPGGQATPGPRPGYGTTPSWYCDPYVDHTCTSQGTMCPSLTNRGTSEWIPGATDCPSQEPVCDPGYVLNATRDGCMVSPQQTINRSINPPPWDFYNQVSFGQYMACMSLAVADQIIADEDRVGLFLAVHVALYGSFAIPAVGVPINIGVQTARFAFGGSALAVDLSYIFTAWSRCTNPATWGAVESPNEGERRR